MEQQLGEKPPWKYVREEENIQLLFLLGEEVGGAHLLLYERGGGDGGEQLLQHSVGEDNGGGQLLQLRGGMC